MTIVYNKEKYLSTVFLILFKFYLYLLSNDGTYIVENENERVYDNVAYMVHVWCMVYDIVCS